MREVFIRPRAYADLESILLRFVIQPGSGDVAPLGSIIISHLPAHPVAPLVPGQVPQPPGNDFHTLTDMTPGARTIDVTAQCLADWNAGRRVSTYALRFATPTDMSGTDDDLDLGADLAGVPQKPYLILHFGVDL